MSAAPPAFPPAPPPKRKRAPPPPPFRPPVGAATAVKPSQLPPSSSCAAPPSAAASTAASASREVDAVLRDAQQYITRVEEMKRILAACTLNPFDILDLPESHTVTLNEVQKQYRKKSLLLHPDKFQHAQAKEAFAMLAKAVALFEDELQLAETRYLVTQAQRTVVELAENGGRPKKVRLTDVSAAAGDDGNAGNPKGRTHIPEVMRGLITQHTSAADYTSSDHLPPLPALPAGSSPEDRQKFVMEDPIALQHVRHHMTLELLDAEFERRRARKRDSRREGEAAKEAEVEEGEKKRKGEHEKAWDSTRDTRVQNWRDFKVVAKKRKV